MGPMRDRDIAAYSPASIRARLAAQADAIDDEPAQPITITQTIHLRTPHRCCSQESKPRPRLSRLRSSDYGGNIRRYNFRNSAANKRVFFFPG